MACINNNFLKIHESYLFTEIAHKVTDYKATHPEASVISLGIGDVTRPLCPTVIQALHQAVDEMANAETFRGYGPEHGYKFLIQTIIKNDYNSRGISLDDEEVFIGRDLAHSKAYGENTATAIDEEVRNIVSTCYKDAKAIINENIEILHAGAKLLLEKEKINQEEFEALFA